MRDLQLKDAANSAGQAVRDAVTGYPMGRAHFEVKLASVYKLNLQAFDGDTREAAKSAKDQIHVTLFESNAGPEKRGEVYAALNDAILRANSQQAT